MFKYNLAGRKILLPNFKRLRSKAIKSLRGEALNTELARIEQLENCFKQLEKIGFTGPRTKIYFNPVFGKYIIKKFSMNKIIYSNCDAYPMVKCGG